MYDSSTQLFGRCMRAGTVADLPGLLPHPCQVSPPETCDGCWEESFLNHRDSKPYGPEAISLDISFPGAGTLPHLSLSPMCTACVSSRDTNAERRPSVHVTVAAEVPYSIHVLS